MVKKKHTVLQEDLKNGEDVRLFNMIKVQEVHSKF